MGSRVFAVPALFAVEALGIDLVEGFVPANNDTFTVLTGGSRNGSLAQFTYLSEVVTLEMNHLPTAVAVRATGIPVFGVVLFPPVVTGSSVAIFWTPAPNKAYRLEFNPGFDPQGWLPVVGELVTNGDQIGIVDSVPTTNRFYRVRVLP